MKFHSHYTLYNVLCYGLNILYNYVIVDWPALSMNLDSSVDIPMNNHG